jgi:hypothetical protein
MEKEKLYRIIGDYLVQQYLEKQIGSTAVQDIMPDVVFVINKNNEIETVELTISAVGYDEAESSKDDIKFAMDFLKGYASKFGVRGSKVKKTGFDLMGSPCVTISIKDKGVIEDIVNKYSLDEMFGWTCAKRIYEGAEYYNGIEDIKEAVAEFTLERFYGGVENLVEGLECDIERDKVRVYFEFKKDVKEENIPDGMNITLVLEDDTKVLYGVAEIAKSEGYDEIFECMTDEYTRIYN